MHCNLIALLWLSNLFLCRRGSSSLSFCRLFHRRKEVFYSYSRRRSIISNKSNTNNDFAHSMNEVEEFDNDESDDFANFDMEAAILSSNMNTHSNGNHISIINNDSTCLNKRSSLHTEENDNHKKCRVWNEESTENSHNQQTSVSFLSDELSVSLLSSLQTHFGHSSFRSGQLKVLHTLLGNNNHSCRDACVFWATGSGKSLCYQLPPLHLNQVAVVVSPLISLMQDQCAKLNNLLALGERKSQKDVAIYLGSAQMDPSVEERALNGEYRLIYVTPEKLVSGDQFLERLARMHQRNKKNDGPGKICLIAVDESHCVSEWGHDFRPEFLRIGPSLRTHPILSSIPILALTATAVPRVQHDIRQNLRMLPNATIVKKSFDRSNLKIFVRRKPKNGPLAAFEKLAEEMAVSIHSKVDTSGKSTIVYCSTRKEVEQITSIIISTLSHQLVAKSLDNFKNATMTLEEATTISTTHVRSYHAALSHAQRTESHIDFLIGKATVIVATVAFGMGIDKPDIRRVIHWGPCKTVEEYYQQMGRAGRDGLSGECVMYCDLNDFVKFNDDFYLGKLKGEAKIATVRSMDALKNFAMSTDVCRRAALLDFFEEEPSFGKWCGTCDTCLYREANKDDLERDFQWEGARVLLLAIAACPLQPWTTIEAVINDGTVDAYRLTGTTLEDLRGVMATVKSQMKRKRPVSYFKDFLPVLSDRGFVKQHLKKSNHKLGRPYLVYELTPKAMQVVNDGPILLPVPSFIREQERREADKRKQTLAELESAGINIEQIPKEELDTGEGEVIAAFRRWHSYLDSLKKNGRTETVSQLDDLKCRIMAWRCDLAKRYRIAPVSVMEDHLLFKVAYTTATLKVGRIERDALIAAGVRSNGIDELTKILGEWADIQKEALKISVIEGIQDENNPMSFKAGQIFTPINSWKYAVYKPNKKTGLAAWEASYVRFNKGEHPQTIAMQQSSGKPIQVATVVGHIFEAVSHGRSVDLHRLASSAQPPTKIEWERLTSCELETGINVTADPATSGVNGERFSIKDFLLPIMGDAFALKDYKERTKEEIESFSFWCGIMNWYLTLRRVGFEPQFESSM